MTRLNGPGNGRRLRWQWWHPGKMSRGEWAIAGMLFSIFWTVLGGILVLALKPSHESGNPIWKPWRVWMMAATCVPLAVLGAISVSYMLRWIFRNPPIRLENR